MKEELIKYETAVLAKEKGFDLGCNYFYNNARTPIAQRGMEYDSDSYVEDWDWNTNPGNYPTKAEEVSASAPTQSLLQRWLRERRNKLIVVYSNASGYLWELTDAIGGTHRKCSEYTGDDLASGTFTTYEKCLESALMEALKLINNQHLKQN